ncbi:MAG: DoxX family protein [Candidatus Hydrogenedentes bacterium]|nr:DoxX family protein [Candidatus Hydrogenedentota bacterium]
MNVFLWVLQILLSLHTVMGAVWKFSHSAEQTMPSLKAIPQGLWLSMSAVELLCALALIVPAFYKPLALLVPIAALVIAAEMLLFTGVHLYSGARDLGPIIYWLIVAFLCGFLVYGRSVLKPL